VLANLDCDVQRRDYLFSGWLGDGPDRRNIPSAYNDAKSTWLRLISERLATVCAAPQATTTTTTTTAAAATLSGVTVTLSSLQRVLATPSGAMPDLSVLRTLLPMLAAQTVPVLVPASRLSKLARLRSDEANRKRSFSGSGSGGGGGSSSWLRWAVDATVRTTGAVVAAVSSPVRGASAAPTTLSCTTAADVDLDGAFVVLSAVRAVADRLFGQLSAHGVDSVVEQIWLKSDLYALLPDVAPDAVDRAVELLCFDKSAAQLALDNGVQVVKFFLNGDEFAVSADDVSIAALKATRAKLEAQCAKVAREADECRAAALKCAHDQRAIALRHVARRKRLLRVQDERYATLEKVTLVLDAIEAAHDTAVTHKALQLGAASLRRANEQTSLDQVDDTMLDIESLLDEQQRTLDAMTLESSPSDTDELELELEGLEMELGRASAAGNAAQPAAAAASAAPSSPLSAESLIARLAKLSVHSGDLLSPTKPAALAKVAEPLVN
jgi:hypothetical protein